VPERLSVKNAHQNTNSTEIPLQVLDTPTSTTEPDDLRITINLSLLFLICQHVAVNLAGCDRTPQ
jgi:hypothetical protein